MTDRLGSWVIAAALLVLPAAHPLLIPLVGVPSHLLWWVHVLPAALVTYRWGRRGALAIVPLSGALVVSATALPDPDRRVVRRSTSYPPGRSAAPQAPIVARAGQCARYVGPELSGGGG